MEIRSFEGRIKWRNMVICPLLLNALELLNPSAKLLVEKPILCRTILLTTIILLLTIKYWYFHTVGWQNTYAKWCKLYHGANTHTIEHHNKHSSGSPMQVYSMFFHITHDQSLKDGHKTLGGMPTETHHPWDIAAQQAEPACFGCEPTSTIRGSGQTPSEIPATGFGHSRWLILLWENRSHIPTDKQIMTLPENTLMIQNISNFKS